jgi:two-component system, LytTR family, response regulator
MIKSIIVEDDPIYSRHLADMLNKYKNQIEILSVCRNVAEAINAISNFNPELIFLDIELEGGETGFDLLKQLNKIDFNVIFTTSHIDDHINEIRMCGIGFIVKPYIQSELDELIDKYIDSKQHMREFGQINTLKGNLHAESTDDKFIWIANGSKLTKVEINNIIYCKSDDPVTNIILNFPIDGEKKLVSSDSIKEFENYFKNTSIIRIHNRFLVNTKYIKTYTRGDGGFVILNNNESIDVSKTYKPDFLKRMGIKS